MTGTDWKKIRGFKRLLHDGVEQGASFVEKHHRHAANKPFDILESVTPIAPPTRLVRTIHDGVLSLVYGSIRGINRVTEVADDWVVERLQENEAPTDAAPARSEAASVAPATDGTEHPDDPDAGSAG